MVIKVLHQYPQNNGTVFLVMSLSESRNLHKTYLRCIDKGDQPSWTTENHALKRICRNAARASVFFDPRHSLQRMSPFIVEA